MQFTLKGNAYFSILKIACRLHRGVSNVSIKTQINANR